MKSLSLFNLNHILWGGVYVVWHSMVWYGMDVHVIVHMPEAGTQYQVSSIIL